MRQISIDTLLARGATAAMIAAAAVGTAGGQVASAGPVPQVVKDTIVVRARDGSRIQLDSIRVLMRVFEGEPLSSMQSEQMARKLNAMAIAFKTAAAVAGGGQRIFIAGPDGIRQFGIFPAKGWIGLTTGGVHSDWDDGRFVQYLDYPPIVSVERRGPAQLAGIVPGDTLVAYDGVDVVAHPINVMQLLTPDRKIAVTVRRDGENKALSLVVGRIPNTVFTQRVGPIWPDEFPGFPESRGGSPGDPRVGVVAGVPFGGGDKVRRSSVWGAGGGPFFTFTDAGVFGASLSPVGPDLARAFKIEVGVLVNDVPDDTPASRAGLKAGDVIVSVGGQSVSSVADVRKAAMLRGENRSVVLQVVRDKKTRAITVK
jgi:membrane-associated protease RseP (regulator of RpoE activity)